MNLNPSSKLKTSKEVLSREIEGETVLLNVETGIYFGLDATGTAVWNALQKKNRFGDIMKAVQDQFEVDPKTCREDLTRFISSLEKHGLLQVHEE